MKLNINLKVFKKNYAKKKNQIFFHVSRCKNDFKIEYEKHKSTLKDWRLKTKDPVLDKFFKWPPGIMLTDPDEDNPGNISGCTE